MIEIDGAYNELTENNEKFSELVNTVVGLDTAGGLCSKPIKEITLSELEKILSGEIKVTDNKSKFDEWYKIAFPQ